MLLFLGTNTALAQDSLFVTRFQQNITQLNKLYCWDDEAFFYGEFSDNSNFNFQEELQENTLFPQPFHLANIYFEYLNSLSEPEKHKLIRYFSYNEPWFNDRLSSAKLPLHLKYLAPALSVMNPLAVGKGKRAGIWQLTHFQGILNGLQINRLIDERFNEQKATEAFVKQITSNKELFGTNELAVLAFLVGNAKLKNTLVRNAENASISEIVKSLPGYIEESISMYQAMSIFLQKNKFVPEIKKQLVRYLSINRELHFKQIAQVLQIPENQLRFLNPQFRYSIVPGDKKTMEIALPCEKYDEFLLRADAIFNAYDSAYFQVIAQKIEYAPAPNRQYVGEKVKDLEIEGKTKLKYTIKSGDVLGFIAEDYDVRVADLKYWNNIYNERKIQAGKTLDIFVDDNKADDYKKLQGTATKQTSHFLVAKVPIGIPKNARKVEHTVKNGESPYVIAKRYNGVSPEAILEWNGIHDARKIQIGQKLIIYLAQ